MTNEQEEAIEKLRYVNRWYDCNNYYSRYELDCIDTVLSLIKAQQEEISKYKTLYERALSDVVKTDKQIDLMAEWISERCFYKDDYSNSCEIIQDSCSKEDDCKHCIKQYFERNCKNE